MLEASGRASLSLCPCPSSLGAKTLARPEAGQSHLSGEILGFPSPAGSPEGCAGEVCAGGSWQSSW